MRLFRPIIGLALLLVPLILEAKEDNEQTYTLQQCLEYAYENNQEIIIANLEIDAAKAKTGEYLSAGFPQVDASASVNKNFILRRTWLDGSRFDPSVPEGTLIQLEFGTPYDSEYGIGLSQMIFNGSYFVGVKASKTYQELSTTCIY